MSARGLAESLLASDNPLKALAELLEDHERRLDAIAARAHCGRCQAMTNTCNESAGSLQVDPAPERNPA